MAFLVCRNKNDSYGFHIKTDHCSRRNTHHSNCQHNPGYHIVQQNHHLELQPEVQESARKHHQEKFVVQFA